MDEEAIKNIKKAGKITAEARDFGLSLIKKGNSVKDLCNEVDAKIIELGGRIAFPSQVSLNDVAAHFCPESDDNALFDDQVVKLDVGAHLNGYIGDSASTVDLSGNNHELVKASREALNNALKITKIGTKISEIGKVIHDTITDHGFSPIRNLSGHSLAKYDIHTAPSIPNYDNGDDTLLEEGMLIAIEPFATDGKGIVYESGNANVYSLKEVKAVRGVFTRKILDEIKTYEMLPFTKRWLERKFSLPQVRFALREMINNGMIQEYPPLVDKAHGLVSQAEHTVLILDKPIITTRSE